MLLYHLRNDFVSIMVITFTLIGTSISNVSAITIMPMIFNVLSTFDTQIEDQNYYDIVTLEDWMSGKHTTQYGRKPLLKKSLEKQT